MPSRRKRRSSNESMQPSNPEQGKALFSHCLPMMPNAKSAEVLTEFAAGERLSHSEMRRVDNVIMFPFCGDAKAPLTGPRVSEFDMQRARKRMGVKPSTAGRCYRDTRVLRNELATAA